MTQAPHPEQQPLYPVTIRRTEPQPMGGAQSRLWGVGDDHMPYLLKGAPPHEPWVPVSELLCCRLAMAAGVPTPVGVVALVGGDAMFGSRLEGGTLKATEAEDLLLSAGAAVHAPVLSAILVFDVFVRNMDRHVDNYLVRRTPFGMDVLAIDHATALLAQGWPCNRMRLPLCNTVHWHRRIAGGRFDVAAGRQVVRRLLELPDDWLDRSMRDLPPVWWNTTDRARVARWWRDHRKRRLRLMMRALDDDRAPLSLLADPRGS